MGIGARAHGLASRAPGRPWTSLLPHYGGQGSFLTPSRLPKGETGVKGKRGPKDLKDTAVERREARPAFARPVRLFAGAATETLRQTALRSLLGEQIENRTEARAAFRSEKDETWLFDNLIWNAGAGGRR